MSNIDIRALLGVPKHANQHRLSRLTMEVHTDELRIMASAVESYTDELIAALEAAEKRIAELEAREINLPPYSFFDFKQGSPFKSGAYCHIDSVNQELSKHGIKMTAAAGKGE